MATLEARIRANEGANLYDLVKAAEMCLVSNVIVQKKIVFPSSSNILEHNTLSHI